MISACSSGYQLFSKEMLVQLKDIRANERLQEIGRRWVALSVDDKKMWNKRKDLLWVQYQKDLAKFKRVRFVCFVTYSHKFSALAILHIVNDLTCIINHVTITINIMMKIRMMDGTGHFLLNRYFLLLRDVIILQDNWRTEKNLALWLEKFRCKVYLSHCFIHHRSDTLSVSWTRLALFRAQLWNNLISIMSTYRAGYV